MVSNKPIRKGVVRGVTRKKLAINVTTGEFGLLIHPLPKWKRIYVRAYAENVDGIGYGLEEKSHIVVEIWRWMGKPARWPMHRAGGRAHGLAPFTSLRVGGYSTWTRLGLSKPRRVSPCGYGKITWAGSGRRTKFYPSSILMRAGTGCTSSENTKRKDCSMIMDTRNGSIWTIAK